MKKNKARTLSAAMALVMTMSLITPAFAAEMPADLDTSPVVEEMNDAPAPYADSGTIYVSATGHDGSGGGPASPLATVGAAYATVQDDGTIVILDDLELTEPVVFGENKNVTITGDPGAAITYVGTDNISSSSGILSVLAGQIALQGLTVQMPEVPGCNGRPLYVGPDGAAVLAEGTVLANGYLAYGGGNVLVDGGTLVIEEGAAIENAYIANNTACYGGGVLLSNAGMARMTGGVIRDNTIHTTQGYDSFGGGVAVLSGSTFELTGGTIHSNSVDTAGGGVYFDGSGSMSLEGTLEVSGNEVAGSENNIYLPDTATHFDLTGAVYGNVGVTCGEADYGVVVGVPGDYAIRKSDEDAFTYDSGEYDVRLKEENLVLYWFTVGVNIDVDGATSENMADETPIDQDYDTVLIPDAGYQLPDDITVSVGGAELSGGEYDYDPDTGALHIPGEAVSGDISITVEADAQHTITVSTTNVAADLDEAVVIRQDTTVITLTPAPRYGLPAAEDITIEGACDHSYDPVGGKLTVSNVTADLTITIRGAEVYHTIYFDPAPGACDTPSKRLAESAVAYGELPTPTLTGYTFSDWFADDTRVTKETPNHLVEDLYLTVRWTARTDIHYEVRHWLEFSDGGVNPGYDGGELHTMTWGGVERQYYLYRADAFEDGVANGSATIVPLSLADLGGGLELVGLTPSGANEYAVTMAPDGSSVFPLYYDRNPCRVTYDANGGTLQGQAYTDLLYGGLYGALPDAARAGYTLIGWFTEQHGGAQVQAADYYLTAGDQTLYAHWAPVGDTKYTVYHLGQVLHDNTVSYDKAPENYTLIQTDELTGTSDTTVDLYGMAMPGFVPSPDNVYTVTIQADGSAAAYLYYDRLATDVSYDAQGGTPVTVGSRLYYGGTFASLPGDPALVGHHFLGWYMAPDATAQKVEVGTNINDVNPKGLTALTLYARWAPNAYDLVFETYGGVLSSGKSVTYGEPVGVLPTAALTGYDFIAWYDSDGKLGAPEGNLVTPETIVSTNTLIDVDNSGRESVKTLYAWYDPIQVTVTFDPAPGALEGSTATLMTYDKPYGIGGAFPTPTLAGYTFRTWRFEDGRELNADEVCKLLSDTTVIARYTPNIYEVFLDVNGGSPLEVGKILATYDAAYGELPTPTKVGYDFVGWYLGDKEIHSESIVGITAAATLTAHWQAKTFNATFDVNGGSDLPEAERTHAITYDAPYGALPTPTRSGYNFLGWYTEQSAGIRITAESVVKSTSDITLYAHWQIQNSGGGGGGGGSSAPTEYTLTFHVNGGSELKPIRAVRNTTINLADYTTFRTGFRLVGWYLDKDLKDPAGSSFKLTENMDVYAGWALDTTEGLIAYLDRENHNAYIEGTPDGLVHPEANITRAEVAMIFYRLLRPEALEEFSAAKNPFADVAADAWYAKATATLNAMGIIRGRGQAIFDPDAKISRAEFTAIAARFSSLPYTGDDLFKDIAGSWAREEINRAARAGWVHGDGSGQFRPDDSITRAEVVTLVNNMLDRHITAGGLLPGMKNFPDNVSGSWYYYEILEAANTHSYTHSGGGGEVWLQLGH